MKHSWIYILKCSDGSYYTGCTTNLEQRIQEHNYKRYNNYTSTRLPVKLVYSHYFTDINDAILAESQIKGWIRRKKEALISGNFDLLHSLSECKNQNNYKNKEYLNLSYFDFAQYDVTFTYRNKFTQCAQYFI